MKELLEDINNCATIKEIELLAKQYIDYYTDEASKYNIECDTIGTDVGINPNNYSGNTKYDYSLNIWSGYIPKNTRIVYGTYGLEDGISYNKGNYYYLDDESYIIEFFKYIKGKEIDTVYDLILHVFKFLKKYLEKYVNYSNRDILHQLIYKNDREFFKPIKEHSIRDFINNGSAECTEYGAMAENIMSLFNLDVYYLLDVDHAYNLIIEDDKASILDFSKWVSCYDINYKFIGRVPYYVEIEDFTDDYFFEVLYDDKKFIVPDYYCLIIDDKLIEVKKNNYRKYGIEGKKEKSNKITF